MNKVFIISFLPGLLFLQLNCASNADSNANQNATTAIVVSKTPVVEANQTNANVIAQATPLPVFTDANAALEEGKKLLDASETEKSIEALKQAVKLNPELAEAHFNLGIAYALLEKVNAQKPSEEPAPIRKGKKEAVKLTASEKAFDAAAKLYEKITKKNPKDDAAFFNLGRSFNKLNKDPEAEKAFRQAVKLNPDDGEYQTQFGAILIKLAKYDEAVSVLKKALDLDENDSQAQDLLDKAEAGQKRQNYGLKDKLEKLKEESGKQKTVKTKPKESPTPKETSTPKANTNQH